MTQNSAHPELFDATLHRRLAENGITVLAVTADERDPGAFTVYLHGIAGKERQERVFALLASIPSVFDVRCSEQTTSIVLVSQRPDVPR
jgi:hypothetical protein